MPGYGSPTPSSRKLAAGYRSPAASAELAGIRANQPGVALKEPAAATQPTPVAGSTVEPTTAVSRQLEQAAAMVLANTSNMLTHAAAALVSSQAPASVQPTQDQRALDLEKAVALVLSSAKQAPAPGTREEWDVVLTDTEEELEVDVRGSEEHLLRELRLMETLGKSQLYFLVRL